MKIELTYEQWQIVRRAETPLRVVVPDDTASYVLLSKVEYDRIQFVLNPELVTHAERAALLQQFGRRAGWDDPSMDVYDDLDPRRRKESPD